MIRKILPLAFILWGFASIAVSENFTRAADSLLNKVEKQKDDTALIASLVSLINTNLFNEPETASAKIRRSFSIIKNIPNQYYPTRLLLMSGIAYDLRGMYDSAFYMYDRGLELAETYNFQGLMGELYNNYSITLSVVGRLEESITYTLKARDIFELAGDSAQLARVYNNLASRYSELRMTDQALEYYLKAASINERRSDLRRLGYNYGNIGLLYHGLNQHELAREFFYKSLQLLDTVQNRYDYSIALHNLALSYLGVKDYKTALEYEERALQLSREINDELGIMNALNGLAQIYYSKGNLRKALEFYDQSEPIAQRLGARYYLMRIFEEKARIFADLNDFRKAFEFNQKFLAIKDSIMTIEKDRAVQKLKDFENERKQQQIQLLTKDSEIQSLNLKRQKTIRNSVALVGFLLLLLAIGLYSRYRYVRKTKNELAEKNKIINYEKSRSDDLLLNILPAETAEELKNKGSADARQFEMATVMFTDFKGFTYMAEKLSAQELVNEIDFCFKNFDNIISKHGVEKIKTIGDSYMCAGGLPVPNETSPEDVVLAALEIQAFMIELKKQRKSENRPFFELRVGIHTGPVIAGIVGNKKFQYDIWGDTVNLASRMESSGEVGLVNVSQTTYEKIKDRFVCHHRGKIEAKNKGAIDMYFVEKLINQT